MFKKIIRQSCAAFSLLTLLCLAESCHRSASIASGTYTYSQYPSGNVWVAQVTSTVTHIMDCTITWTGYQGGQDVGGNQTMRIPGYPGFGAAEVGRLEFSNVANFQGQPNCYPYP